MASTKYISHGTPVGQEVKIRTMLLNQSDRLERVKKLIIIANKRDPFRSQILLFIVSDHSLNTP